MVKNIIKTLRFIEFNTEQSFSSIYTVDGKHFNISKNSTKLTKCGWFIRHTISYKDVSGLTLCSGILESTEELLNCSLIDKKATCLECIIRRN